MGPQVDYNDDALFVPSPEHRVAALEKFNQPSAIETAAEDEEQKNRWHLRCGKITTNS
jgi:hypothetical protein